MSGEWGRLTNPTIGKIFIEKLSYTGMLMRWCPLLLESYQWLILFQLRHYLLKFCCTVVGELDPWNYKKHCTFSNFKAIFYNDNNISYWCFDSENNYKQAYKLIKTTLNKISCFVSYCKPFILTSLLITSLSAFDPFWTLRTPCIFNPNKQTCQPWQELYKNVGLF